MVVKSVLGDSAEIKDSELAALTNILRIIDDKRSLSHAVRLITDEKDKLAAERAAVGSLSKINSLRTEAEVDRHAASAKLSGAEADRKAIVSNARVKADEIVKKAEAAAAKNVEWAAELKERYDALISAENTRAAAQRDADRRMVEANKKMKEANDLIAEHKELNKQLEEKLAGVAKAAA